MVPSEVICGVTVSRRKASTYVTVGGPPNCAWVTMGTRTPCLTIAWILFWVTTRGRDNTFNKPRDSAIVRMASMRILLLEFWNPMPLVGLVTPRFENKGIWLTDPAAGTVLPMIVYRGLPPNIPIGDVPTLVAPPIAV